MFLADTYFQAEQLEAAIQARFSDDAMIDM